MTGKGQYNSNIHTNCPYNRGRGEMGGAGWNEGVAGGEENTRHMVCPSPLLHSALLSIRSLSSTGLAGWFDCLFSLWRWWEQRASHCQCSLHRENIHVDSCVKQHRGQQIHGQLHMTHTQHNTHKPPDLKYQHVSLFVSIFLSVKAEFTEASWSKVIKQRKT